jgi:hypothetical protein
VAVLIRARPAIPALAGASIYVVRRTLPRRLENDPLGAPAPWTRYTQQSTRSETRAPRPRPITETRFLASPHDTARRKPTLIEPHSFAARSAER